MPVKTWHNVTVTAFGSGLVGNAIVRADWLLAIVGLLIVGAWFWWAGSLTGWIYRRRRAIEQERKQDWSERDGQCSEFHGDQRCQLHRTHVGPHYRAHVGGSIAWQQESTP